MSNCKGCGKLICKGCGKPIVGTVKIHTYKRKLGKRNLTKVDYYDEKCFQIMKKARPTNERKKQKRVCKARCRR
jgi:hypothetical protein